MLADNDTKKRVLADILHTIHSHEMDEEKGEDSEEACPYCGKDSCKSNSECRMHSYHSSNKPGGKKAKGKAAALIVGIAKKK